MDIKVGVKVEHGGKVSISGWLSGAWFSVEGTPEQLQKVCPAEVFAHAWAILKEAEQTISALQMTQEAR